MSENTDLMQEEMNANPAVGTDVPATDEKSEDKRVWKDSEGNEVSMSQFIREQFTKNNKSRKAISDEFDINYRTVYGATVNMTNDAEPATRGRGIVNPKIHVTADNKVLGSKVVDGVTVNTLNGEDLAADAEVPETTEADRNTWIKEQVAAGVNRGDIAKFLDLSYGVIYGLTKDEEGSRQKYEVEYEDPETHEKKTMGRSEYIRKRVADGINKADIAKELNVEYSVVWQATKKDKSDAEKYDALVDSLAKMVDKMSDKVGFLTVVDSLKSFAVVEEVKAEADAAPVASPQA